MISTKAKLGMAVELQNFPFYTLGKLITKMLTLINYHKILCGTLLSKPTEITRDKDSHHLQSWGFLLFLSVISSAVFRPSKSGPNTLTHHPITRCARSLNSGIFHASHVSHHALREILALVLGPS